MKISAMESQILKDWPPRFRTHNSSPSSHLGSFSGNRFCPRCTYLFTDSFIHSTFVYPELTIVLDYGTEEKSEGDTAPAGTTWEARSTSSLSALTKPTQGAVDAWSWR